MERMSAQIAARRECHEPQHECDPTNHPRRVFDSQASSDDERPRAHLEGRIVAGRPVDKFGTAATETRERHSKVGLELGYIVGVGIGAVGV
jgi:hypothetical protein